MAPAKKTAPKAAAKQAAHPSFIDMIKECVATLPKEDTRYGASRPQIKKFLASTYKIDMSSASNTNNVSRAITSGAEKGVFALPKGPSGRVKLAPKNKGADKENEAPAPAQKKAGASKTAAKAPAKKAAAAPLAKKAAASSTRKAPAAAAAKKAAPAPAKKAAAAKAPARKAPVKKAPATKTKSSTSRAATKPRAKAPAKKTARPPPAKKPAGTKSRGGAAAK